MFQGWPKQNQLWGEIVQGKGKDTDATASTEGDELLTFLLLTIFLAPILSVIVVGGYGFLVWMSQLI